jgi:hypothetical protein
MSKKPPTLTELAAFATAVAEFQMWSVAESSRRTGYGVTKIRDAIANYELAAYKNGKNTTLDARDVMVWAKRTPLIPGGPNPITQAA